jgi:hypothetical protein
MVHSDLGSSLGQWGARIEQDTRWCGQVQLETQMCFKFLDAIFDGSVLVAKQAAQNHSGLTRRTRKNNILSKKYSAIYKKYKVHK